MRVALIGTRGVPARYGGFETAVEEIGRRLADRGHEVVVYCRGAVAPRPDRHLGMELVHLPAARRKSLETLSHTLLSVGHLVRQRRTVDAAIVFNAANAPFLPLLRLRRSSDSGARRRSRVAAQQVAGSRAALLPRRRGAVRAMGRRVDRRCRRDRRLLHRGVRCAHRAADATVPPIQDSPGRSRIAELGLEPGALPRRGRSVRTREPRAGDRPGLRRVRRRRCPSSSWARPPTPTPTPLTSPRSPTSDPRIRLLGGVWDPELLDELYAQRAHLPARALGGRNQPVAAARHGSGYRRHRLRRQLQPGGARRHRVVLHLGGRRPAPAARRGVRPERGAARGGPAPGAGPRCLPVGCRGRGLRGPADPTARRSEPARNRVRTPATARVPLPGADDAVRAAQ